MKLKLRSLGLLLFALSAFEVSASDCTESMRDLLRPRSKVLKELNVGKFPTKQDIRVLDKPLVALQGKLLNALSAKNSLLELSYVVAPDDRMYLVMGDISLDGNNSWMAEVVRADGTPWSFPIKEAGAVRFNRDAPDKVTGNFSFERSYGVELSDEEIDVFARQVDDTIKSDPTLSKHMRLKRPTSTARALKCSEAFTDGRSAKQFIGSKVFVSSTLLTAGIVISHPERFDVLLKKIGLHQEDPDRNYDGDMLFADYTSTAVNSFFQAYVGYHISSKGVQFLESRIGSKIASSMLARGAASMGSIGLQSLIYASLTDNNAKGVGLYNIGYSVFSIAKSHFADDFLYQKLPQLVYNACLVSPALKVVVGQRTVRFVEGIGSTTLYLKGREFFVGE